MQFNRPLFQVRTAAALSLVVGAFFFGGWSSFSVRKNLDTIAAMAPAPVLVKKGSELRTAEAAAAQVAGAQAFKGAGDSMLPIYSSGTAIVVSPCDFSDLRPGMSVVYVNHDGRGVAHTLIEKTRKGWVAQGVNNADSDEDLVTSVNLVGVVTQAYASADTSFRREASNRVMQKAQVALNLSKVGSGSMVVASR